MQQELDFIQEDALLEQARDLDHSRCRCCGCINQLEDKNCIDCGEKL